MRQIVRWSALVAGGLAALVAGAPAVASARPDSLSSAGGVAVTSWSKAIRVPGLSALNKGGSAAINAVSCAAAGDCSAGGLYTDARFRQQAFVVSEVRGKWGNAVAVPGLAALNKGGVASITSISCASPGNCGAVGTFGIGQDSTGFEHTQGFVVNEVKGSWGRARYVPGLAALNVGTAADVFSISCTGPGDCSAGGAYSSASSYDLAFVVTESNGVWGKAQRVGNTAVASDDTNALITTVSCASPGNCAAGGENAGSGAVGAIVVSQVRGHWGRAQVVPGSLPVSNGQIQSMSCRSAGNCSAGGWYYAGPPGGTNVDYQAFVASETGGVWHPAANVPGLRKLNVATDAQIDTVSCGSPGNCAAGGFYASANIGGSEEDQAFVVTQRNGMWGTARQVPGTATLNARHDAGITSISCPQPGDCDAGGYYTDSKFHRQAFVVADSQGSWQKAIEVPGSGALNAQGRAQVNSISCPTTASCAAGGSYTTSSFSLGAFIAVRT